MADDSDCCVELVAFRSPAYVYQVPPARTSAGHRADDWDVNKWLAEVECVLLTRSDDSATVRLMQGGELFAACPLPTSGPVASAVEPVVDSSRYFVLRVADEASGRHAFLGLGFRTRDAASDFKMALADHERACARSAEAVRRRDAAAAERKADAAAAGDPFATASAAGAAPTAALGSLSLIEGAKITVNVPSLARKKEGAAAGAAAPPVQLAVPLPPPPGGAARLKPPPLAPPPAAAAAPPPPPTQPAQPAQPPPLFEVDFSAFQ